MKTFPLASLPLLALVLSLGCASSPRPAPVTAAPTAPRPPRHGGEFRVIGATTDGGHGDAYDAAVLFDRAVAAMRAQRCEEALRDLDRLVAEFPSTRLVFAGQFNRGVCLQRLQRWEAAAEAFRAATREPRDSDLVRDAWFRLAVVGESGSNPPWVIEATDALLARPTITLTDRVETLARRAAALLARGDLDAAERAAEQAMGVAPTPESVRALDDDTHAAQARTVGGEVSRMRASAVVYQIEAPNAEEAIVRRVQHVTHAHVQYNDAIRIGNPHWAAAAGFRIGEMYRDLYRAIVDAPTPAEWDANARAIYRRRTGDRLRPLLQGALRSWEATLSMAQRNGIQDNDWVRRADEALGQLRALISGEPSAPRTIPQTTTVVGGRPAG